MMVPVYLCTTEDDLHKARLLRGIIQDELPRVEVIDCPSKPAFASRSGDQFRLMVRETIRRSQVVVCLIGAGTAKSRWIDWEINTADALNKGVVGVRMDAWRLEIPSALSNCYAEMVGWEPYNIARAIDRAMTTKTKRRIA
jgi:hypothetical protein